MVGVEDRGLGPESPASLRSDPKPEGEARLDGMDAAHRDGSWHLITRDGRVASAGAAVPFLLRELPGGSPLAWAADVLPRSTDRAYRAVVRRRFALGRLLHVDACDVPADDEGSDPRRRRRAPGGRRPVSPSGDGPRGHQRRPGAGRLHPQPPQARAAPRSRSPAGARSLAERHPRSPHPGLDGRRSRPGDAGSDGGVGRGLRFVGSLRPGDREPLRPDPLRRIDRARVDEATRGVRETRGLHADRGAHRPRPDGARPDVHRVVPGDPPRREGRPQLREEGRELGAPTDRQAEPGAQRGGHRGGGGAVEAGRPQRAMGRPRCAARAPSRRDPATPRRGWPHRSPASPITASTSISTFQRGSRSAATATIVAAGRISPNTSPCTRPTSDQSCGSVR